MNAEETKMLEQVRATKAEQDKEDAAARQALGNPLPGPLKQAMAVNGEIPVGRWNVRRLCDGDFEVLVEIDHPIRKVMEVQFDMAFRGASGEGAASFDSYTPRGPSMWQLAWMVTRPARFVRDTVKRGGVAALKEAAEEEFYEATAPELVQLYLAVAQQISTYWSTAQSYGPAKAGEGEDAAADAPANPSRTSSAPGSTASGGSSRSTAS